MLHEVHPERLGPFSPALLMPGAPRLLTVAFRAAVLTGPTRMASSWLTMRIGILAGRLHLNSAETFLSKVAQHIMQWHGAMSADGV